MTTQTTETRTDSALVPRLPVPSLADTLREYLRWIRPLVDDAVYARAEQVCARFGAGAGARLQQRLLEFDAAQPQSWLRPLWDEKYLRDRTPLAGNVNFSYGIRGERFAHLETDELCARAALALVRFYRDVVEDRLAPELRRGRPLCTAQYARMFGSCRIPREESDVFFVSPPSMRNRYAAVFWRQNIYVLPLSDGAGEMASLDALRAALREILACDAPPSLNIGALTACERDRAAALYRALAAAGGDNEENLRLIERALFCLYLDERTPGASSEEMFKDFLISDGSQGRFFNKPAGLIVGSDRAIGCNNEHSGFDGAAWMNVLARVVKEAESDGPSDRGTGAAVLPRRLRWIATPALEEAAADCAAQLRESRNDLSAEIFWLPTGRDALRGLAKSPDAVIQLALQAAFYRTFGRVGSTYEAVSMRAFSQGRTECARACSTESLAFSQALTRGENNGTLRALALAAVEEHWRRLLLCQSGRGVERHLFGLKAMLEQEGGDIAPQEDLFSDEGYRALKYDILSTTGTAGEFLSFRGNGPSVPNGYGVAYMALKDRLFLNVTCRRAGLDGLGAFCANIDWAMSALERTLS